MIKLKSIIMSIIMLIQLLAIVTVAVLTVLVVPVQATTNQSNQDMNRLALLIAPDPDFQINVYPKPSTGKQRIGYGSDGDVVTVIEQVGSNQGYTWDYVRFEKSPQLEGWIREDFVVVQENNRSNGFSDQFAQSGRWRRQHENDRQDNYYRGD